jgi:hypothetical protein
MITVVATFVALAARLTLIAAVTAGLARHA